MLNRLREAAAAVAFPVVYVTARITDLFKPMGHLLDWAGYPYMYRWNIVPERTWASRVLEKLTGYRSIRLHHICVKDTDRDLHNHPFEYTTVILKGGYVEVYADLTDNGAITAKDMWVKQRLTIPGRAYRGHSMLFHRIARVFEGGSWSLFMMRKNSHQWGFMTDDGYVDRREYLQRRNWPKQYQ